MQDYLSKISKMLTQGLTGKFLTFENLVSEIVMNEKATIEKINNCSLYFHRQLPNDYKLFLENYDGGTLFKIQDFCGFEFLGSQELIIHDKFERENFGDDWDKNIILFCLILGDAEYLGFKMNVKNEYQIIHCIMDQLPSSWEVIDWEFADFMERLIDGGGKKFWLAN